MHLPVTMGYDRYPERLIDEKRRFLTDKIARGVRLFFTHDLGCALATPTRGRSPASSAWSTSARRVEALALG